MELSPLIHPVTGEECHIGEFELTAAVLAAMHWSGRNGRCVILCTDNQNVMRWAESARARAPAAAHLLRALNFFGLTYQVDTLPAYVRSYHSSTADGLARWSETSMERWATKENMPRATPTEELRRNTALSYKTILCRLQPRIPSR